MVLSRLSFCCRLSEKPKHLTPTLPMNPKNIQHSTPNLQRAGSETGRSEHFGIGR